MRRTGVVALVSVAMMAVAIASWAAFSAGASGSGATRAQAVGAGNAPTVSATGSSVTVSWSASTLSGGSAVDGYTVTRYDASHQLQTTAANCAGTITALTCTENGVPDGTWGYSVTPIKASWQGAESAKATVLVDTVAPTVTLTAPTSASFTNDSTPTLSGAAGNASGDSTTVTARIYQGTGTGGAVVQTMNVTRSGASWSTTAAALADGTYTAQAAQTDTVGNTGASSANTFTVDTVAPTPTAVTLVNGSGGAVGKIDAKKDSLTITFSEKLKVSSLCNTWSNDDNDQTLGANGVVVVTVTNNGTNDVLTVSTTTGCTFNLGSISLGGDYVTATSTFSGNGSNASSISWSASTTTLTLALGDRATGTLNNTAQATGTPTYTPNTAITDRGGNAISGTTFTAPATSRF